MNSAEARRQARQLATFSARLIHRAEDIAAFDAEAKRLIEQHAAEAGGD